MRFLPDLQKLMTTAVISRSMRAHRLWLANAVIGFLIIGSLYDIVRDTDHWPFSNYGMYSELQLTPTLAALRLFGVTDGPSPREFLLEPETLDPFDRNRLTSALVPLMYDKNKNELLTRALRDTASRYEALRRAARHHAPPLQAIRLYRFYWQLDPMARNVDHPDRKQLLFEFRVDSPERVAHE